MEHRRWPRMRRATRRAVIFSACKVLSGYGDGDDLPRWHRTGESFSEAFSSREISRRRFVSFLSSIFIYRRQIIVERVYIYYDHWLDYIIYTHVRFFDGIFEIKFCSFGFLSFFSTFIIDIYNGPFLKLNYWIVNPIVFERQCIHVYFRVHKIKSDKCYYRWGYRICIKKLVTLSITRIVSY